MTGDKPWLDPEFWEPLAATFRRELDAGEPVRFSAQYPYANDSGHLIARELPPRLTDEEYGRLRARWYAAQGGPVEVLDERPPIKIPLHPDYIVSIKRRPAMARPVLSPKFHGAWLGAVGGVNIGGLVVGLIESYITHKALPLPLIDLITTVTGAVVAAVGSYVAPLLAGLKTSELAALVSNSAGNKAATASTGAPAGGAGAPLI